MALPWNFFTTKHEEPVHLFLLKYLASAFMFPTEQYILIDVNPLHFVVFTRMDGDFPLFLD